jgi:hypothetical protein
MPASWTNVAVSSAFELIAAGRSYFLVEHLLRLVALIDRHKEATGSDPGCVK